MVQVVGIVFQKVGHMYYYAPSPGVTYEVGEAVVVESLQCQQIGFVALAEKELAEKEIVGSLKTIIKKATPQDLATYDKNRLEAQDAWVLAKEKVAQRKLDMKITSVEYAFDKSKLIFCFTADGRVDFRELVKDLAGVFKTRIELRQVGVRDQAKILGGIGPCGRPVCCATFLGDFMPVSIKMAKDQGLSLNPAKISGLCGRLMCCLQYEDAQYEEAKKVMPDYGQEVTTPEGTGKVVGLNLLSRVVKVKVASLDQTLEYDYSEVAKVGVRHG
ncbi:PSP1 domain-containing protein [Enterococcus timonensis]|uniref:PSP1 domain-containing protein n=1 Tax=Enterococcus timonensis TaxID=1852364 RepID=UPI0008D976C1|nr:stage 0 sporulation family protein [Enterococcus timonensis]